MEGVRQFDCSNIIWLLFEYRCKYMESFHLGKEHHRPERIRLFGDMQLCGVLVFTKFFSCRTFQDKPTKKGLLILSVTTGA